LIKRHIDPPLRYLLVDRMNLPVKANCILQMCRVIVKVGNEDREEKCQVMINDGEDCD